MKVNDLKKIILEEIQSTLQEYKQQEYCRLSTDCWLRVSIDKDDLEYNREILKLKQDLQTPIAAKVEKAKLIAIAVVDDMISSATEDSNIALEYSFTSQDIDIDKMDWEALVSPEPPEDEYNV